MAGAAFCRLRRPRRKNATRELITHLSGTTVADKHELEGGDAPSFGHDDVCGLLWRGYGRCFDCAKTAKY